MELTRPSTRRSRSTFGAGAESDETVRRLTKEHFDFRPGPIIERFGLRRPVFRQTATYGHLGRPELHLPWERTDLADTFRKGGTSAPAFWGGVAAP